MSKFNSPRVAKIEATNHAGGDIELFDDPRFKFYMAIGSNLLEDQYYRSVNETISEIRGYIRTVTPEFTAKLAVYARTEMNLRTIPLVIMVELARMTSGNSVVSKGLTGVITRADQLSEALAYYQVSCAQTELGKVPKQILKGIRDAFGKFDEYQLSKYQAKNKNITLRDAMFLSHPRPRGANRIILYNKIAHNELKAPVTWETTQSMLGEITKDKTKDVKEAAVTVAWEQLIDEMKMGYMAMLRNLRNFLDDGISSVHVDKVCAFIINRRAISNSKQFPWRFYVAAREIEKGELSWNTDDSQKIYNAIVNACIYSLCNMSMFPENERILSVADISGSMQQKVSKMGTVSAMELSRFYGRMLYHSNRFNRYIEFATNLNHNASTNPFDRDIAKQPQGYGYGTDAHKIMEYACHMEEKYDSIVIFTDNQFWKSKNSGMLAPYSISVQFNTLVDMYRKDVNPDMKLYLVDLVGYSNGAPVVLSDKNFVVSGFTSDTFKTINNIVNSGDVLDLIEGIEL